MALLSRLIAKIRVVASYSQVRFQEAEMKDYENFWVGQRTSKHDDEDFKNVLCKRDIDNYFGSMCEEIEDSRPVSLDESEENESQGNAVESAFKLGYLQGKKEILKIIDDYEIDMLSYADKCAEEK